MLWTIKKACYTPLTHPTKAAIALLDPHINFYKKANTEIVLVLKVSLFSKNRKTLIVITISDYCVFSAMSKDRHR
jgi:hypothetical protein